MVIKKEVVDGRELLNDDEFSKLKENTKKFNYCRRCEKVKDRKFFSKSFDTELDKNGYLSICSDCLDDIFKRYMIAEYNNMNRVILKMCRMTNTKYEESAITTAKEIYRTKNRDIFEGGFFVTYRAQLKFAVGHPTDSVKFGDLTFVEPMNFKSNDEIYADEDLSDNWGTGYEYEDYQFLEKEYDKWTKTHKSDTMAEKTLLREICWKQYEIRKARIEAKSTSSLVKELQDLMKTASIDPAKTSIAGSGKSQDTFSAFIKTIEENEPADYYKDRELFKDYDNIDYYFKKFITRPLKTFLGLSRDFNATEENDFDNIDVEESVSEAIENA